MHKIGIIFSVLYTWPLWLSYNILMLLGSQRAQKFKSDLDARCRYKPIGFFRLMYEVKGYRNLFYCRMGSWSNVLKLICPPDNSLQLPSGSKVGESMFLMHPHRTIVNVKSIGDNFMIFHNCTLGANIRGGVPEIGNNVTMYAASMVLGGVKIGNNVKIGAGCVVVKDVPDNCTVIGNPAFIVKKDGIKVNIKL